jgi:valyl-tRNA synthetase
VSGPDRPALASRFDPGPIEARWREEWERRGYARAPERPSPPTFVIAQPPPNVTGILTLGHVLGDTIRDTLVRWHRMRGEPTLWIPGVDHAGLATQVEVRRRLAKEHVALESLSREEAVERVDAWRREHEAYILRQWRAMGLSLDMTRYRYTLDPGFRRATRHAFVELYREGLIYRGERIVNWDPRLRTAISDLEVVHREETGELLYVRYPWADGAPGGLTVATVRPETIFGDIAVAVHPDDARHHNAVGRRVRVPLTERTVPVIADAGVDPAFGNGALKITPRHDALDYEIFRRHTDVLVLPPSAIDERGRLEGDWVPETFRGLDRGRARPAVAQALETEGFLERREAYAHTVGYSERSDAVVEPRLSNQWFVRMRPLADLAVRAVEAGEVRLHPDRWTPSFFRWMEGIQDWCISRQIAWGHPIPVLYCGRCGAEICEEEPPTRCPKCGAASLTADPDVLDTWFSSWLWPFATLGWPDATDDLTAYYPTSVLVTGRDIMFFWVARMMMAGPRFVGAKPFSHVYFTGMLRDARGRRMSKHLGNSPDPLDVIAKWGADTLRFAVLFPNPTDQDGPFKDSTLEGARNFLTKLWNLVRLLTQHLPRGTPAPEGAPALDARAPLEDRWILSRWRTTAQEVDRALASFEPTRAAGLLYGFVWHDVADRYAEIAKEALQGIEGDAAARRTRSVLLFVLERALRELHPMVPHVTEELWHALPHAGDSLMVAPWPRPEEARADPAAETAMGTVLETLRALRNLRAENHVPLDARPPAWVRPGSPAVARLLAAERDTLVRLARLRGLEILEATEPPSDVAARVTPDGEVFVELPSGARVAERETLARERAKLLDLLARTRGRLEDPGFRTRAPAQVVRDTEAKAEELAERVRRIEEHLGGSPAATTEEAPS